MTDAKTTIKGYEAGEEVAAYNILRVDTATGKAVKVSSAKAVDSIGVVSSTGGSETVTGKRVAYVERGRTKAYAIVESSTAGFNDDIEVGDALVIAGTGDNIGQAVAKWNSTIPANAIVGKAFGAVKGNTTVNTIALIDVEWD